MARDACGYTHEIPALGGRCKRLRIQGHLQSTTQGDWNEPGLLLRLWVKKTTTKLIKYILPRINGLHSKVHYEALIHSTVIKSLNGPEISKL